jgi:hypothetical protein
LYPRILAEVLAFHDNATECVDAAVPVPVSAAIVVGVWALLVKVSAAVCAPVVAGLKVTVKDALWPAAIVSGSESPLTVKVALFDTAEFTVTLLPLALKVPVAVPLLPSATLPTAIVVGVTDSWPALPPPDGLELRELTPWHPVSETEPVNTSKITDTETARMPHILSQLLFISVGEHILRISTCVARGENPFSILKSVGDAAKISEVHKSKVQTASAYMDRSVRRTGGFGAR